MAIDTVAALVEVLRSCQLLEPEQLEQLARAIPPGLTDPRSLAKQLIKKGWLTPYQVNQIFQGQATSLTLGQYRVLERLGEGGMGQVLKARHQKMGRIVALKVIRKDKLENADAVKRFHREIQAVATLSHPNVVIAYDADAVNNTHFFAMEFVDGIDLSALVKERGPLPVGEACNYIRQTALGLHHAHEHGMVHRDIKPHNLLLTRPAEVAGKKTPKPTIKILDLGLARLHSIDDDAHTQLSQDGSVMGTPDFMAPEQAKNSHKVDHRADLYSLGCTFYFLLTGQALYVGGSNIEKLLRHQMDAPPAVETLRPDVPVPIRQLLQRMLTKTPEQRVGSAEEVAAILAPFADESGTATGGTITLAKPGNAGRSSSTTEPYIQARGGVATLASPATAALMDPARNTPGPSETVRLARPLPRMADLARNRKVVIAAGIAGLLLLLSGFTLLAWPKAKPSTTNAQALLTNPLPTTRTPVTSERKPPPEYIYRYLPDDTFAVVTINTAEALQSNLVRGPVREKLDKDLVWMYQLLGMVGVEFDRDVKRMTIAMAGAALQAERGFIVLHGNFDVEKFRKGVQNAGRHIRSHETGTNNPQSNRYYEAVGTGGEPSLFAAILNHNTIIASPNGKAIGAACRRAGGTAWKLNDPTLQGLLEKIEGKPTIYAAISGTGLGQIFRIPQLLEPNIRYLSGGVRLSAEDATVEIVGGARNEQALKPLAGALFPLIVQPFISDADEETRRLFRRLGEPPVLNERELTATIQQRYTAREFRQFFLRK